MAREVRWNVEDAILLRREGWSWTALGSHFCRHPTTIKRYFEKHKIKTGKRPTYGEIVKSREACINFNNRKGPKHPTIKLELPVLKDFSIKEFEKSLKRMLDAYR